MEVPFENIEELKQPQLTEREKHDEVVHHATEFIKNSKKNIKIKLETMLKNGKD